MDGTVGPTRLILVGIEGAYSSSLSSLSATGWLVATGCSCWWGSCSGCLLGGGLWRDDLASEAARSAFSLVTGSYQPSASSARFLLVVKYCIGSAADRLDHLPLSYE